ncbi:Steryl acetyl hydrolase 1 [Metarhizium anisopliae]
MASSAAATPTLREKLDLLPALGSLVFTTLSALLTGWRRGPNDEPSLYLHVVYAAVRKLIVRLSSPQQQWVFPSTDAVYKQQAASFNMAPRTVELRHGAKGLWIGDPDAGAVLVWYHGGGFNLPALNGHLAFFMRLVRTRPGLAVFFVAYGLAPAATYPTQLRQAVEALRSVVAARPPSRVLLGGDSAGGNLVAAVLAHLAHRHPEIDALPLPGPLAAAVMMAPWTALDGGTTNARLAGYNGADILDRRALEYWAGKYMGDRAPDYYTDASSAPAEWFRGLPVGRILVLAGGNEILLPSIDAFVKTLEAGYGPVEFYVAEREAHIAPFVNLNFHSSAPTGQGDKLQSWLDEVVASRGETAHL